MLRGPRHHWPQPPTASSARSSSPEGSREAEGTSFLSSGLKPGERQGADASKRLRVAAVVCRGSAQPRWLAPQPRNQPQDFQPYSGLGTMRQSAAVGQSALGAPEPAARDSLRRMGWGEKAEDLLTASVHASPIFGLSVNARARIECLLEVSLLLG